MRLKTFHRIGSGGAVALLFALASVTPLLLPANAHAQAAPEYEDSEPGNGSSVRTAPAIVSATFSEPLDDSSTLAVYNECGDQLDNGNTVVELDEMSIDVVVRHWSGTYTVDYKAVSLGEITGTTEGSFTFDVAEGHPCDDDGKKKHDHDGKGKDERKHDHGGMGNDDHDEHDGGGGGGVGHGDHDGQIHSEMSQHTDHSAMSGSDHGGHEMAPGGGSHGKGHGNHKRGGNGSDHAGNGRHEGHGSPNGSLASDPLPRVPADGRAVLIALALCAGMGIIGGAFLRSSVN